MYAVIEAKNKRESIANIVITSQCTASNIPKAFTITIALYFLRLCHADITSSHRDRIFVIGRQEWMHDTASKSS